MRPIRSSFAALLFGLAVAFSGAAAAQHVVTSSLMVPVDGLVFQPGGNLENVALTGRVHLVTQFTPGDPCIPSDPCRVFVNLADVKGIGLLSLSSYIAIGAVNLDCIPTDPCVPQFAIMPVAVPPTPITPPNPIMPITFVVRLAFDESGHLSADGTTVGLAECTHDLGC